MVIEEPNLTKERTLKAEPKLLSPSTEALPPNLAYDLTDTEEPMLPKFRRDILPATFILQARPEPTDRDDPSLAYALSERHDPMATWS
jgi:hypothetical protein